MNVSLPNFSATKALPSSTAPAQPKPILVAQNVAEPLLGSNNRSASEVIDLALGWAEDTPGNQWAAAINYVNYLEPGTEPTWRAVIVDTSRFSNYDEFASHLANIYGSSRVLTDPDAQVK